MSKRHQEPITVGQTLHYVANVLGENNQFTLVPQQAVIKWMGKTRFNLTTISNVKFYKETLLPVKQGGKIVQLYRTEEEASYAIRRLRLRRELEKVNFFFLTNDKMELVLKVINNDDAVVTTFAERENEMESVEQDVRRKEVYERELSG